MQTQAIIIGGGIGGLATALALHQHGIPALVYEQAERIREVGAGLVLAPNALAICGRLGLRATIEAVSWPLSGALVADARGQILTTVEVSRLTQQYGFGMRVIHRGALQKLLLDALPAGSVHTSKKVVDVTTSYSAARVTFADGSAVEGGFVLGADGIRSSVRQRVFKPQALRYSGQTCWRAIVDYALPASEQHTSVEYWGRAPGLRVGLVPMGAQQVYLYLTAAAPANQHDAPGTLKAKLLHLAPEFIPRVAKVLRACDESCFHRADLFDLPTLPTWAAGRVALLGDAAHATTPNLGQGACQALEDAYTLAACLSTHEEPEPAFATYERLRKAKANQTVQLSRRLGQVVNLPGWLKPLVFKIIRIIPQSVSEKQLAGIYNMNYLGSLK